MRNAGKSHDNRLWCSHDKTCVVGCVKVKVGIGIPLQLTGCSSVSAQGEPSAARVVCWKDLVIEGFLYFFTVLFNRVRTRNTSHVNLLLAYFSVIWCNQQRQSLWWIMQRLSDVNVLRRKRVTSNTLNRMVSKFGASEQKSQSLTKNNVAIVMCIARAVLAASIAQELQTGSIVPVASNILHGEVKLVLIIYRIKLNFGRTSSNFTSRYIFTKG